MDDSSGHSGNQITGGVLNRLPTENTMARAEIDFDSGKFISNIALDSRGQFASDAGCSLGDVFSYGRAAPSLGTLVYAPLRYGRHLATASGFADDSSTGNIGDLSNFTLHLAHGISKGTDVNGTATYTFIDPILTQNSLNVYSGTAFYGPSNDQPTALALDLGFQSNSVSCKLISSLYDFKGFEALIRPAPLFGPSPADISTDPSTPNQYMLKMVGPYVCMDSSGNWRTLGPVFGEGHLVMDENKVLNSSVSLVAFGGPSDAIFNNVSGSSKIVFDSENFAVPYSYSGTNSADYFADTGKATPAFQAFYAHTLDATTGVKLKNGNSIDSNHSFIIAEPGYFVRDPGNDLLVSSSAAGIVLGGVNILHESRQCSVPSMQTRFVGGMPAEMKDLIHPPLFANVDTSLSQDAPERSLFKNPNVVLMGMANQNVYTQNELTVHEKEGLFGVRVSETSGFGDFHTVDMINLFPDSSISCTSGFLGSDGVLYSSTWDNDTQSINVLPSVPMDFRGPLGRAVDFHQNFAMTLSAVGFSDYPRAVVAAGAPALNAETGLMLPQLLKVNGINKNMFADLTGSGVKIHPNESEEFNVLEIAGIASGFTANAAGDVSALVKIVDLPKAPLPLGSFSFLPENELLASKEHWDAQDKVWHEVDPSEDSHIVDVLSNQILLMGANSTQNLWPWFDVSSSSSFPDEATVRLYSKLPEINGIPEGQNPIKPEVLEGIQALLLSSSPGLNVEFPVEMLYNTGTPNMGVQSQVVHLHSEKKMPTPVFQSDGTTVGPFVDMTFDTSKLLTHLDIDMPQSTTYIGKDESLEYLKSSYLKDIEVYYPNPGMDSGDSGGGDWDQNMKPYFTADTHTDLKNMMHYRYGQMSLRKHTSSEKQFKEGLTAEGALDTLASEAYTHKLKFEGPSLESNGYLIPNEFYFDSTTEMVSILEEIHEYRKDPSKQVVIELRKLDDRYSLTGDFVTLNASVSDLKSLLMEFNQENLAKVDLKGPLANSLEGMDQDAFEGFINHSNVGVHKDSIMGLVPYFNWFQPNVEVARDLMHRISNVINSPTLQSDLEPLAYKMVWPPGDATEIESNNMYSENEAGSFEDFILDVKNTKDSVSSHAHWSLMANGEGFADSDLGHKLDVFEMKRILLHTKDLDSSDPSTGNVSASFLSHEGLALYDTAPTKQLLDDAMKHPFLTMTLDDSGLSDKLSSVNSGLGFLVDGLGSLNNPTLPERQQDPSQQEQGIQNNRFSRVFEAAISACNIVGIIIENLGEKIDQTSDSDILDNLTAQKTAANEFLTKLSNTKDALDDADSFKGSHSELAQKITELGSSVAQVNTSVLNFSDPMKAVHFFRELGKVTNAKMEGTPVLYGLKGVDQETMLVVDGDVTDVYAAVTALDQTPHSEIAYSIDNKCIPSDKVGDVSSTDLLRKVEAHNNMPVKVYNSLSDYECMFKSNNFIEFYNFVKGLDSSNLTAKVQGMALSLSDALADSGSSNEASKKISIALVDSVKETRDGTEKTVVDFKEFPDLIFVSKDLFFIPSVNNLKGIMNLPSNQFNGEIAIQGVPGVERFKDMSWGFWSVLESHKSTNANFQDGIGAFAIGNKHNLSSLSDLHGLRDVATAEVHYCGNAMGGIFDVTDRENVVFLCGDAGMHVNIQTNQVLDGWVNLKSQNNDSSEIKFNIHDGDINSAVDLLTAEGKLHLGGDASYMFNGTTYNHTEVNGEHHVGNYTGAFYNHTSEDHSKNYGMAYYGGSFDAKLESKEDGTNAAATHAAFGALVLERPNLEKISPERVYMYEGESSMD